MRHVGRVLPKAVENAEVLRAARAGTVLRRWEEIVGELLASKSTPDRYDKGTVWVATQGSAWAQELRLKKPQLLERMETMAGERGMFVDIRFGVRPPKHSFEEAEATLPETPRESPVLLEEGKVPLRDRPAVPPEPIPEKPNPPKERSLTIRERAERRLKNWPKDQ